MTIKELISYLKDKCKRTHKQVKKAELSGGDSYFEGKFVAYEGILKKIIKIQRDRQQDFEDSLLYDQDPRERI